MKFLQTQPIVQPANANFTSAPIDMRQQYAFSLEASGGAGSLAGTIQLQVCNIPVVGAFSNYAPPDDQWVNLGSALTFAQSSVASSQLISKTDNSYVSLRIVYTDSSSGDNTATITCSLASLGV